jgi:glycosyltransferase involved in cell wall biosynthesis
MSLSVIIPCRDDVALADCVRSVDADAEVVVVLNGSPPAFAAWVEGELDGRARLLRLERPNLARALEEGIRGAAHDRVLLMDSDCVLAPGAIAATAQAMDAGDPGAEVYRGRILFDPGRTRGTALVARSRRQRQGGQLMAYKPPLALWRGLAPRLGGHVFDARLPWKEDADLDHRVRRAGIRVVPVDGCVIHHAPLSIAGDLRSTFCYGMGAAIAPRACAAALAPVALAAPGVAQRWRRGGVVPGRRQLRARRRPRLCAGPHPPVARRLARGAGAAVSVRLELI